MEVKVTQLFMFVDVEENSRDQMGVNLARLYFD
jgi:hypothetical protein